MTVVKTLSPSLMAILIEQVAEGNLRQAAVISNINAGLPVSYKNASASFTKDAPGLYTVTLYLDAEQTDSMKASSAVEARLLVLDYLVGFAKEANKTQ